MVLNLVRLVGQIIYIRFVLFFRADNLVCSYNVNRTKFIEIDSDSPIFDFTNLSDFLMVFKIILYSYIEFNLKNFFAKIGLRLHSQYNLKVRFKESENPIKLLESTIDESESSRIYNSW